MPVSAPHGFDLIVCAENHEIERAAGQLGSGGAETVKAKASAKQAKPDDVKH